MQQRVKYENQTGLLISTKNQYMEKPGDQMKPSDTRLSSCHQREESRGRALEIIKNMKTTNMNKRDVKNTMCTP